MALLRIGLTGGIGSGKSTVAAMLVARGAVLVDTDAIARQLTAPGGAAIEAIAAAFGREVVAADGSLDRVRMREAVFAEPAARRRLESILHPLIGAEADRLHAAALAAASGAVPPADATDATTGAAPPSGAVVFDVPLLVESGRWRSRVDRVWVVDCSEATQLARVVRRAGWSEASARAVVAQQASRAARRAAADAVLDNDGGDLAALERDVDALWRAAVRPHPS